MMFKQACLISYSFGNIVNSNVQTWWDKYLLSHPSVLVHEKYVLVINHKINQFPEHSDQMRQTSQKRQSQKQCIYLSIRNQWLLEGKTVTYYHTKMTRSYICYLWIFSWKKMLDWERVDHSIDNAIVLLFSTCIWMEFRSILSEIICNSGTNQSIYLFIYKTAKLHSLQGREYHHR